MEPEIPGDGLLPVVVQDATDGAVLMVAYMNREALEATRARGYMHFWSRSRGTLWRKGETSGNGQRVVGLRVDCDGDCFLATVIPRGPACHTGGRTCFGGGTPGILGELETVVQARARATVRGSYTAKLLGDEVLRLKKVVEEAGEVVLAAKAQGHDALVREVADLVYHVTVVLGAEGISWREIMEELRRRRT